MSAAVFCVVLLGVAGTQAEVPLPTFLTASSADAAVQLRHCNPCDCKPWRVASQETSQQITSNLAASHFESFVQKEEKMCVVVFVDVFWVVLFAVFVENKSPECHLKSCFFTAL